VLHVKIQSYQFGSVTPASALSDRYGIPMEGPVPLLGVHRLHGAEGAESTPGDIVRTEPPAV